MLYGENVKEEPLRLNWNQYVHEEAHNIGNAYGYRVLANSFIRCLNQRVEITPDAQHWVGFVPSNLYVPRLLKTNWMYTMVETETIPASQARGLHYADYVMVPSNWAKMVLGREVDAMNIFVVPPPVDLIFSYKERRTPGPGEPFRFLFVGSANARKGLEEISYIYNTVFVNMPNVEFYVKTTNSKAGQVIRELSVIRDDRDFSKIELRDLYHSAHCLISPSRGEAFNLVLAEAMATGLPCVATNYGGPTDYFNETNGYPVNFFMTEKTGSFIGRKDLENESFVVAAPEVGHLIEQMLSVCRDYDTALEKGKRASETIRAYCDWAKAGAKFIQTIRSVEA